MTKLSAAPPVVVPKSGRALPGTWAASAFIIVTVVCWLSAGVLAISVVNRASMLLSSDQQVGAWFDTVGLDVVVLRQASLVWHYAGSPIGTFALMVIATVWLLVIRRWGWATYLVVCAVGGLVIAETMKHLVARVRPVWPDPSVIETGGSFPSGHSMGGIYAWTMVGVVVIYLMRRPVGTILGWCLITFGVLMAPSRLILGVHWPSDVVAGWMFALGWVLLVSAVALIIATKRSLKSESEQPADTAVASST